MVSSKATPKEPEFTFTKPEFYLHLGIIAVHLTLVCNLVMNYSFTNPPETTETSYLSSLSGRGRDNHDIQWETYRTNLPILGIVMAIWHFTSKFIQNNRN